MSMRNGLYNIGLLRTQGVDARVISVGNLTTGGTGKTPVSLALIALLKEHGHSCGVVTRGYGRRTKGVKAVQDGALAALDFGDEPVLVRTAFPDVPVVVGEKRVAAARHLLKAQKVDFIISDDSFQHRSLKRDLNLLLFDATENMKNYRVLPVGQGRESLLPALKRADYFVVTKSNLTDSDQLKDLLFWLNEKGQKPILKAAYIFRGFYSLSGVATHTLKDSGYLVSGVAKPETVEKLIAGHISIVKHNNFDDHHRYTHLEVESILDEASSLNARWIVTTAKDATKLSHFHSLRERLWVIDLGIQFEGDLKAFYADIDRLARAGD